MPSDVHKSLKSRMDAFVKAVLRQARADEDFANELAAICGVCAVSEDVVAEPMSVSDDFNAIAFLQESRGDEASLRSELEAKTNDQLSKILKKNTPMTRKEARKLERNEVIDQIVVSSRRALNQGGVFLGDGTHGAEPEPID